MCSVYSGLRDDVVLDGLRAHPANRCSRLNGVTKGMESDSAALLFGANICIWTLEGELLPADGRPLVPPTRAYASLLHQERGCPFLYFSIIVSITN